MKYFCVKCKLGYCEKCTSHTKCKQGKEYSKNFNESLIKDAIGELNPQALADNEIKNFLELYEEKRLELKKKLNKLKEHISGFDDLYKVYKIDLYNLTGILRNCKVNKDPRILHAKSWINELRFKFNKDFKKKQSEFNQEITNLFYGLHENDKILPIEVLNSEYQSSIMTQTVCIPPQFFCNDTTEIIFRPLINLKISTIYFGLPLLVKGEGKVNKIEISKHVSNDLETIYTDHLNARLKSSASSQVGELELYNCKSFEKNYEYVIRIDYTGFQTFMAYSKNLSNTHYSVKSTNTEEHIYKSRVFGFKIKLTGDNN